MQSQKEAYSVNVEEKETKDRLVGPSLKMEKRTEGPQKMMLKQLLKQLPETWEKEERDDHKS